MSPLGQYSHEDGVFVELEVLVTGDFKRDLERAVKKEASKLIREATSGAQGDLDVLRSRAQGMDPQSVRDQVKSLLSRHGLEASAEDVETYAAALSIGDRVVLTWDGHIG